MTMKRNRMHKTVGAALLSPRESAICLDAPRNPTRETGIRLYTDQIKSLDLLVALCRGRKDRSTLIREAIDEFTARRLRAMTENILKARAA